jgi:hypothetical protein
MKKNKKKLIQMEKIVIFGAGYHGRMAYRKIREKDPKKKIIFIDNGVKKKAKIFFKEKILNPKSIMKTEYEKIILCGRYIKEQKKQLKSLGIKKNLIFWGRKDLKPNKKILSERLKKYLIILKEIFTIFEKNNINYWADYSGLLALMRKQNIAEMSDFDICFNANDSKKIIKLLKKNSKYRIETRYHFNSKIEKKIYPQIIIFGKCNFNKMEPPTIDFIPRVFYKNKNEELKLDKNITIRSDHWNGYKTIGYKGLKLRAPLNSEQYLKKLYGKTWNKEENFWYAK